MRYYEKVTFGPIFRAGMIVVFVTIVADIISGVFLGGR